MALSSGTSGDDILHGTREADVIVGGDGDDRLFGHRGDDRLEGGNGSDVLRGGHGSDTLLGGSGDDHLSGGSGNDVLAGGAGDDVIRTGSGFDRILYSGDDIGDDRIVDFVKTYVALHENQYYLKDYLVDDPIAGVRFPKYAAAATLDVSGKTYYFISDETRAEFESRGVTVREGRWGHRVLVIDDPDGNQIFVPYPNEPEPPPT